MKKLIDKSVHIIFLCHTKFLVDKSNRLYYTYTNMYYENIEIYYFLEL